MTSVEKNRYCVRQIRRSCLVLGTRYDERLVNSSTKGRY